MIIFNPELPLNITDFTKFTDIIPSFDMYQHLYRMPNMFEKQSLMKSVNWQYSEKVQEMKAFIIETIAITSNPITMKSLKNRFTDLSYMYLYSKRNKDYYDMCISEKQKFLRDVDRFASDSLWDFEKVCLTLLTACQINLTGRRAHFHLIGNDLKNYIEEELSSKTRISDGKFREIVSDIYKFKSTTARGS